MPKRDLIVIGASAGGVEALRSLAAGLPGDLPACILIVLHVSPDGRSVLPEILTSAGEIPAFHARSGDPLTYGRIYVAPPNYHMVVKGSVLRIVRGPRENGHRPAVDPLFRSAALAFGPRVIGIVVSGALDDGTVGLMVVKREGGIAIVQDPAEASYSGMPQSAVDNVAVDYIVPIASIPGLLVSLVTGKESAGSGPGGNPGEPNRDRKEEGFA